MMNAQLRTMIINAQLRAINNTGGDLVPAQLPEQLRTNLKNDDNNNECNRTLIVGPLFLVRLNCY